MDVAKQMMTDAFVVQSQSHIIHENTRSSNMSPL